MDLPHTIPTSFVPRPASAAARKPHSDFTGAFGFLAYAVLGITFALAIGVFLYGRILAATQSSKDMILQKAEAGLDPATVESFVQLRDRLDSSEELLSNHVAFSGFFTALDTLLPATVRFTSIQLSIGTAAPGTTGGESITFDGTGVAKTFNALAATSNAFAADGRIKDAVFSNFVVNKDNSVSFALSASLDPKLIAFASPSSTTSTSSLMTASSSALTP